MFGETIIVTNRELKLDNKRRIIIPSSTGVEEEERLHIMFNPLKEYLLLYKKEDFEKVIQIYEDYFATLLKEGKIDAKKYRNLRRYLYASLCFGEERVDKYHRITLPTSAIERLKMNSSLYAVGNKQHLELYKDKETYQALSLKKK